MEGGRGRSGRGLPRVRHAERSESPQGRSLGTCASSDRGEDGSYVPCQDLSTAFHLNREGRSPRGWTVYQANPQFLCVGLQLTYGCGLTDVSFKEASVRTRNLVVIGLFAALAAACTINSTSTNDGSGGAGGSTSTGGTTSMGGTSAGGTSTGGSGGVVTAGSGGVATAGSGGTIGDGGPTSDVALDPCTQCSQTYCANDMTACANDTNCLAIADCVNVCDGGDLQSCAQQCQGSIDPTNVAYNNLYYCLDQSCKTQCQ
jgi:hypothetical protein